MKKYNENSECIKCGFTDIKTEFEITELIILDQGRLHRTCERCGYLWFEKSLDDNA